MRGGRALPCGTLVTVTRPAADGAGGRSGSRRRQLAACAHPWRRKPSGFTPSTLRPPILLSPLRRTACPPLPGWRATEEKGMRRSACAASASNRAADGDGRATIPTSSDATLLLSTLRWLLCLGGWDRWRHV